jgi:hypothetical protein
MRSVIVLGCGRSGTSMLTGLFAETGYWMGKGLFGANAGNPKGLFESREINRINESILAPWTRRNGNGLVDRIFHRYRGWLTSIPVEVEIGTSSVGRQIDRRVRRATGREPYCFKDPRFSYTLDAWRPHLRDPLYLCVFRQPEKTVESIVRESQRRRYLRGISVDHRAALDVWQSMYRRILERHSHSGRWIFVHADQVLDGVVIERLEDETGARLDRSFADRELQHARGQVDLPVEVTERVHGIYHELCKRAGREPLAEESQ